MVMTFVLHPLSNYNSNTEPRDRFLLSLIQDLTIDFISHFILSLIDVYKDTTTHDKLIFPFAITRIIHHASVSYPESAHFSIMGAISGASIRRSEAQLRLKRPRIEMETPLTSSAPSTFTPSSVSGVTLEAIMAQLEHMDARLGTLNDELCQVNTHVSCIARQQAIMGGFTMSPSPSPQASEDESYDDVFGDDNDDEDEDTSSSGDEEMIASQ